MRIKSQKTNQLAGQVQIPGSKSQTIRALLIAAYAQGESKILNPLISDDTEAARNFLRAFGIKINDRDNQQWLIAGHGGSFQTPKDRVTTGNSGITTIFYLPLTSMVKGGVIIDCGQQMKQRPVAPIIKALRNLGVKIEYLEAPGRLPVQVSGRLTGGETKVEGKISQYLSSLLLNCPLAPKDTFIQVKRLQEIPYVEMTLNWLKEQGIRYQQKGWENFHIFGRQKYQPFIKVIPADFSSASYFLAAGVLVPGEIVLQGLDFSDTQGDKELFNLLQKMGAKIKISQQEVWIKGGQGLQGGEFDLSDMPDMVPTLAVIATAAKNQTIIRNVAHARLKETDRIQAIVSELSRMGAKIKERQDGLVISTSRLQGTEVNGYDDHRIIMALSLAGLIAKGQTVIKGAEGINKTFPNFIELMQVINAQIEIK